MGKRSEKSKREQIFKVTSWNSGSSKVVMINQKQSQWISSLGFATLFLFWGSGYSKPPILEEFHLSYKSTKERLLDPNVKGRYNQVFADTTFVDDSTNYLAYPRSLILENLWCYSNMESSPLCKTTIYNSDSSTLILEPDPHFSIPTENGPPIRRFTATTLSNNFMLRSQYLFGDPELVYVLQKNDHDISHIQIYKKEKMDEGGDIAFGVGVFLVPAVLGSMLLEAVAVAPFTKRYNWVQVAGGTALILGGYAGYRVATYTDEIRIQVIDIKF